MPARAAAKNGISIWLAFSHGKAMMKPSQMEREVPLRAVCGQRRLAEVGGKGYPQARSARAAWRYNRAKPPRPLSTGFETDARDDGYDRSEPNPAIAIGF